MMCIVYFLIRILRTIEPFCRLHFIFIVTNRVFFFFTIYKYLFYTDNCISYLCAVRGLSDTRVSFSWPPQTQKCSEIKNNCLPRSQYCVVTAGVNRIHYAPLPCTTRNARVRGKTHSERARNKTYPTYKCSASHFTRAISGRGTSVPSLYLVMMRRYFAEN